MKSLLRRLMSHFFRGLLALLPFFITITIVLALFGFVERRVSTFTYLIPDAFQDDTLIIILTELTAAVILFCAIAFFGLAVKTLWGRVVVRWLDNTLGAIPGLSVIYKAVRQVIELLTMDKSSFLMKPVLVEYPCTGLWAVAFNTGEVEGTLRPDLEQKYYTVFIPTTPNPTSGFLIVMPESKIRPLDISAENAVKLVLTGGMVK